jgi:predicted nucleic acid-binding protein
MKVIVDTDVWSEALRKPKMEPPKQALVLRELIQDGRVQMIGPIRQEILSGLRESERFVRFREILLAFPDRMLETELFEQAAAYSNLFRRNGIQISATDALICACAITWNVRILTKDADFTHYTQLVTLPLITF